MNRSSILVGGMAAVILSACSTLPATDPEVEHARASMSSIRSDAQVAQYAPLELRRAEDVWGRTESAWRNAEDTDEVHHLAYLTAQEAALAREAAHLRATQAAISQADAERERVQLRARTREADLARQQAQAAQIAAEQRAQQANAARAAALLEQQRAERARADASAAAAQAQLSQQHAAAAEEQAALAHAEAQSANQRLGEVQRQAQQLATEVSGLKAQSTNRGEVITLSDVLFNVNQATLNPGGERAVREIARVLDRYPTQRITIAGFTDATGSPEYNRRLSENRASAVRSVLIDAGVTPDRITTRGYGEAYPVATNGTDAGRQLNRRVEILIVNDIPASASASASPDTGATAAAPGSRASVAPAPATGLDRSTSQSPAGGPAPAPGDTRASSPTTGTP